MSSAWDQPIERKSGVNFKKNQYYAWGSGFNYLRVVGEPTIVNTHYLANMSVKCLGDACPICKDNKQLWAEYGKESKNHGYLGISTRAYFNVIDRTIGKVCPNAECGIDIKKLGGKFPPACPKCGTIITAVDAVRLDKIRIMNISDRTFNEIVTDIIPSVRDESGNIMDIHSYDLAFNSVGEGKERRSKPEVPEVINTDPVEVDMESLFDLSTCFYTLTADEIGQVRRGTSYRDIFAARKSVRTADDNPAIDPEELGIVSESIESMARKFQDD